jgi:hypothetical protein
MASEYDPANPDENVEYYLAKLADLYEKFRPFAERPGLFAPELIENGEAAESGQLELFAAPAERQRTDRGMRNGAERNLAQSNAAGESPALTLQLAAHDRATGR